MSMRSSRRTDIGTVLVHLVLIVSFVVTLGTGLRIASDDPEAAWLSILDPILPMEHLWFRHLIAGVAMAGALAGYAVYVVRARLAARIRFDVARARAIWRGGQTGVSALNVVVVWLLLIGLTFETVTGAAIFLDAGQTLIALHHWVTWLCLACVVAHICLHVTYGGVRYALKIFKPGRLRIAPPPPDLADLLAEQLRRRRTPPVHDRASSLDNPPLHAHPLATAIAVALVVA